MTSTRLEVCALVVITFISAKEEQNEKRKANESMKFMTETRITIFGGSFQNKSYLL